MGVEANKPDAVAARLAGGQGVEVESLPVLYPQGAEKQLIKALLGREVPPPPGLPMDAGVVVQNVVGAAVYDAVCSGRPLTERVVTVAGGGVSRPGLACGSARRCASSSKPAAASRRRRCVW